MAWVGDAYGMVEEIEADVLFLKAGVLDVDLDDMLEVEVDPLFDVENASCDGAEVASDVGESVETLFEQ